jgi:hypothetical protein
MVSTSLVRGTEYTTTSQYTWDPDQTFINQTIPCRTSYNNARCVAASGSTVHSVWAESYTEYNCKIYYKRSINNGESWSNTVILSNDPTGDTYGEMDPAIAVEGLNVYIVWSAHSIIRNCAQLIYFTHSNDGGISFSTPVPLNGKFDPYLNPPKSVTPSIAVFGSNICVAYSYYVPIDTKGSPSPDLPNPDFIHTPNIVCLCSVDGGVHWGLQLCLTHYVCNMGPDGFPSVSVFGNNAYVVWNFCISHDNFYAKLQFNANVPTKATIVQNCYCLSNYSHNCKGILQGPSVSATYNYVYVVWYENNNINRTIKMRRSTDSGVTWNNIERLPIDDSLLLDGYAAPVIAVSGNPFGINPPTVHIIFLGPGELYNIRNYKGCWENFTIIRHSGTFPPGYASVALGGPMVHTIWTQGDCHIPVYQIHYTHSHTANQP